MHKRDQITQITFMDIDLIINSKSYIIWISKRPLYREFREREEAI